MPPEEESSPHVVARLIDALAWNWGAAAWLLAAHAIFTGQALPSPFQLAATAGLAAVAAALCGFNGAPGTRRSLRFLKAGLLLVLVGAVDLASGQPLRPAAWLAGTYTLIVVASRWMRCVLPAPEAGGHRATESLRWLILGSAAVWVLIPFYSVRPSGAGDAYWYKLMLADFITQVRQNGLPVWAGQTEYAFCGAVIPLRLAPGYQHAGALLDAFTGHSLDYIALSNLLLCVTLIAAAFSAYFFLRRLLPGRPWSACAMAVIYTLSPAVISPLMVGDQYMTFLSSPLLPAGVYFLWRMLERDAFRDLLALTTVLAALWTIHPPIALCLSFFTALAILAKMVLERRVAWGRLAASAGVFLCLGSLPFVSVLTLGIAPPPPVPYMQAVYAVADANRESFPGLFLPIGPKLSDFVTYQPGYGALLLLAFGLAGFVRQRIRPAGVFLALLGLVVVILFPARSVSIFVWKLVPATIVNVLNVWPLQRFVGIAVVLILALGAAGISALGKDRRPAPYNAILGLLLVGAMVWTVLQVQHVRNSVIGTIPPGDAWRLRYERHNLLLTRYSFNPYPQLPDYYSHGYMAPELEHRLLRTDGSVLETNADSAVRRGPLPSAGARLLASGTWRAVNELRTATYLLMPQLTLPPKMHLALRLESRAPGDEGWLQILGQDVFREYILPDSGFTSEGRPHPRSYGTRPTSSPIIPLYTRAPNEQPVQLNILRQPPADRHDFDFANYELWSYDPQRLPVTVKSWAPYRMEVDTPEPANVETPRLWLPNYRARVNGHNVTPARSPDGRVMFAVPAGHSNCAMKYVPPLALEASYWLAVLSWLFALIAGLVWMSRACANTRLA